MRTLDVTAVPELALHLQSHAQIPRLLTRDGHAIAAVVPADDDVERLLFSVNSQFQAILERSQKRLEAEGGISSAELRAVETPTGKLALQRTTPRYAENRFG